MKFSAFVSATAVFALAAASPLASAAPEAALEVQTFDNGNSTAALEKRQARYGTIQFFNSRTCDKTSGVGNRVDISTEKVACINAFGRHSLEVQGCRATVLFYEGQDCRTGYYSASDQFRAGTCWNIDTGRGWGSSLVACNKD